MLDFLKESALYSMRLWIFLTLLMLPMIAFAYLIEAHEFGPVSRFNLFMLSLTITLGLTSRLSSLISSPVPRMNMKLWQWKFGIELLAWLKKHELATFSLLMLSLLIIFIPLNSLWVWLVSAGVISSGISAFICLILLLLPFFLVPYGIIAMTCESIIKPEKPSLPQIKEIVEKVYAPNQLTGETLERAKKTWIRIPGKKARIITQIMAIPVLAMLLVTLVVMQLVELKLLYQNAIVIIQPLWILGSILVLFVYVWAPFFGEKKTKLDILFESEEIANVGRELSEITKRLKSFTKRILDAIERILDRIKNSVLYRLMAVLGVILGLLASALRLMGFVWMRLRSSLMTALFFHDLRAFYAQRGKHNFLSMAISACISFFLFPSLSQL